MPDEKLEVIAFGDKAVPWFNVVEWDGTTQVYCEDNVDFKVVQGHRELKCGNRGRRAAMVNPADRFPELPYLDSPGRCPRCGADLRPEPDQVVLGGSWLAPDGKGGFTTTGLLISYQCPQCGTHLVSGTDGRPKWEDIDPGQLRWVPAAPAPE